MDAILAFFLYLCTALVMLFAFIYLYSRITPYNDFAMIRQDNIGAAIILTGAVLGFTFPLLSAIYYTHSLLEMAKWGAITGGVQLVFIVLLRRVAGMVVDGKTAPSILLASIAIAIGLLNAVSISY
jgi:putative membrane protein